MHLQKHRSLFVAARLIMASRTLKPSMSLSRRLHDALKSPLLMVVVAFSIRLAVMSYTHSFEIPTDHDNWKFGYETGRIARSIASGQGFSSPVLEPSGPTAWLPPIYPYLLAGIFKLFGIYSDNSALVALMLSSVFSALTCLTIFSIGRRTFGLKVAVWAGWSWAFFPYAVFWSAKWIWATSLATFLFSLVFLVALYLEHRTSAKAWLGLGILWGLIALTETALLSTLPFFIGWLWYRLKQNRIMVGWGIGTFFLVFALSVSPWIIRNYLIFDELVPIRSNFGLELRMGNYEGATGLTAGLVGVPLHPAAGDSREMEKFRQMGELPYMAEKKRQAVDFIMAQPGTFIWLTVRRVAYFWAGTPELRKIFFP